MNVSVISIGYAVQALNTQSREFARMQRYAAELQVFHLIVFTLRRDGAKEPVQVGNLTIHPTNSRSKVHALWDAYRIGRKLLQAEGTWVVSSQDPFETSLVGRALARTKQNVRHQVQLHADVLNDPDWRANSLLNRIRYHYGWWVLRRSACIRVVSARIKSSLVHAGVAADRITVLPIQVEFDQFLKIGAERQYDASKVPRILFMGRLAPEKNIERIIAAVQLLISKGTAAELEIVGSGSCEAALKAQVAAAGLTGVVTFTPWVAEPAAAYAAADIFALASHHEGYALVLIEAMAAGLPIVTTDVGCVGEVLQNDVHGFVVTDASVETYAAALGRLVANADLRQQLGTAGHQAAAHLHTTPAEYAKAWVRALRVEVSPSQTV